MGDRRDQIALCGTNVHDVQHEARRVVALRLGEHEVVLGVLRQDGGRKGAIRLPKLDLDVDEVSHLGPPRVGEDASVAERARPPLEPPLGPPDHLSRLKPIDHALQ